MDGLIIQLNLAQEILIDDFSNYRAAFRKLGIFARHIVFRLKPLNEHFTLRSLATSIASFNGDEQPAHAYQMHLTPPLPMMQVDKKDLVSLIEPLITKFSWDYGEYQIAS